MRPGRGRSLGAPPTQQATPPAPLRTPGRPGPRGGRLVPILLALLALATVLGGIAVSQLYWADLRTSMARMDATLESARARQAELARHFAEAQALLIEQQRHLAEVERSLRGREAALAAERAELERERSRQRDLSARGRDARLDAWRAAGGTLAERLDAVLAGGLAEPGGRARTADLLAELADWAQGPGPRGAGQDRGPDAAADAAQAPSPPPPPDGGARPASPAPPPVPAGFAAAIAEARAALDGAAAARTPDPARTLRSLQALETEAVRLYPRLAGRLPPPLAAESGTRIAGQLRLAALALQRNDPAMYRLALDTAAVWLAANFDPSHPEANAVRARVAELRERMGGPPGPRAAPTDAGPARDALVRLRAMLGDVLD